MRKTDSLTLYFVTINGKRQYFTTFEFALLFARTYFATYGTILGIESYRRRTV